MGDRLIVLNNFWPTGMVQDPAYKFNYVSYALWRVRNLAISFPQRNDMQIFGYPSESMSVPTAGLRSYASVMRATVFTVQEATPRSTEEDAVGLATTFVDFNTGVIEFELKLSVVRNGTTVVLGTLRGIGAMGADRSRFSGTLTSPDSALVGQFIGNFYGPAGQELGVVFGLNGAVSGGPQAAEQRIVGAVLGK